MKFKVLKFKKGRQLAAFFIFMAGPFALGGTPFGDGNEVESGLKNRKDVLFFGGFESNPWMNAWGMAWGPDPPAQGSLVTGSDALDGHSLRVKYPKGTIGGQGGFQFLTDFSKFPIEPQESLYLRYYVRFDPGFEFVKGGKLPGLAGGAANTGGHKPNGKDGWSARIMWRPDGKIVQYVYHPDQSGDYGEDFAWDFGGCPRFFAPGKWQCLETFVKMNTPGKKDGVIISWLDGDKALEVMGLRFRDIASMKIDKFYFDTFFGGGDPSWATPRDQFAQFDNFAIAKNYIGIESGNLFMKTARNTPRPIATNQVREDVMLFQGRSSGNWSVSHWSDGKYNLSVKAPPPHGVFGLGSAFFKGDHSVLIQFPEGKWGGVQFDGPPIKPSDFKTISLWVYPTSCNVEFRVRLESGGSQTGVERIVTPGPRHEWNVDNWNFVDLPLADFQIPGTFNRIVLTSNSAKAVAPFYVDDLFLGK